MPTARIGVITGMMAEVDALSPPLDRNIVQCAAAQEGEAERLAHEAAQRGATVLASIGIAGGLDPGLATGTIVIGTAVRCPRGAHWACDAEISNQLGQHLSAAGLPVHHGAVLGSPAPLSSVAAKRTARAQTDSAAVDMESAGVARAAAATATPLVVLRVVCDTADSTLPLASAAGLGPDGTTRIAPVLLGVLRRPWEIPALIGLGRDYKIALARLPAIAGGLKALSD